MGSERKAKEEDNKLKKKRTSHSPSEDEGKSKRSRPVEDKDSKKRHKSDKPTKHSSDNKEQKSDKKHKDKSRKHDMRSNAEFKEISSDDYFAKNNEFATWLKEEKNTFFSDLSSAGAHELFLKFVKRWNHGKLEAPYYEGISTGPRTSHKWKIKK